MKQSGFKFRSMDLDPKVLDKFPVTTILKQKPSRSAKTLMYLFEL